MDPKRKWNQIFIVFFSIICIGLSILQLFFDFHVPGLQPLVSAALCFSLWHMRLFPGGIWTFMCFLIIGLDIAATLSQIINAIT